MGEEVLAKIELNESKHSELEEGEILSETNITFMQNVKAAKKKKILAKNELNESGNKKKETIASNLESQISSFLETAKNAKSKVNLDMKSFKCKECNKTFQRYEVLQTHLKGAHQKFKPVKCNICQDSFTGKSKLKKHMDEV